MHQAHTLKRTSAIEHILNPLAALEENLRSVSTHVAKRMFAKEMRHERRINKSLPVHCRMPNQGTEWFQTSTVNISNNGACILINHNTYTKQPIELEIGCNEFNSRRILKAAGRIVYVSKANDNQYYCRIAFNEKIIHSQLIKNMILSLADINCLFIEKYSKDAQGIIVDNADTIKETYKLIYKEYLSRSLCKPNEQELFYNAYGFAPTTKTFILKRKDQMLGSVSLILDSPLGLPMESIFSREINDLRAQRRNLAEIGALALNSDHFNKKSYSFKSFKKQAYLFKLYKTMFDYARSTGKITDLVIGCHPKHTFMYKYIGFETLTAPQDYHGANGAPAVLMKFNIEQIKRNTTLLNQGPCVYFFKDMGKTENISNTFNLSYFFVKEHLFDKKDLWNRLSMAQQAYLENCYAK